MSSRACHVPDSIARMRWDSCIEYGDIALVVRALTATRTSSTVG